MATTTLTLTDFLLARIAEDEGWAEWYRGPSGPNRSPLTTARVLAECEAKRRIVERYVDVKAWVDARNYDDEYAAELSGLKTALEFLALPYADHPDFREEWMES